MSNDFSSVDYKFTPSQFIIGGQMMFVAFGALVLVSILTGLDCSTHGWRGYTNISVMYEGTSPGFSGFFIRVYRSHHIWREDLGYPCDNVRFGCGWCRLHNY